MAGRFVSWTEAATRILPGALDVVSGVRRQMGAFTERAVGAEFDERFRRLTEKYHVPGEPEPFGVDIEALKNTAVGAAILYRHYFRVVSLGAHRVPHGRVLLISNHSGQIPLDGAMISAAMFLEPEVPRLVRTMVDRRVKHIPGVSDLFRKSGQVEGTPENCSELLSRGEIVLSFPEGVRGISKPFSQRYRLERFGKGFMRLAMLTRTPIVPVAVVGAEEQYLSLGQWTWMKERLGLPALPLLPQLLLPGGVMPLPTKYRIEFGEPMRFEGDTADVHEVSENAWVVRQAVSAMLDEGLKRRSGVFS